MYYALGCQSLKRFPQGDGWTCRCVCMRRWFTAIVATFTGIIWPVPLAIFSNRLTDISKEHGDRIDLAVMLQASTLPSFWLWLGTVICSIFFGVIAHKMAENADPFAQMDKATAKSLARLGANASSVDELEKIAQVGEKIARARLRRK